MKKRILAILLCFCMIVTATTSIFAKSIVEEVIEAKLGIKEGEELTDEDHRCLTRGEFANLLYTYMIQFLSVEIPDGMVLPFTDVKDSKYKNAIKAVYASGIMNGVSDTEFAPNDFLTRQEASTILYRGMQQLYPDMDFTVTKEHHFTDESQIADWAMEAVIFLYDRGFMLGTSASAPTISPLDTIEAYQGKLLIKRLLTQFF